MDIKSLIYSWRFGKDAEKAMDFDRRIAALTWIHKTDAATMKRIEWINGLPEDQRLPVAELYEKSFALQVRLIHAREKVLPLIAEKNKLQFAVRDLEARIDDVRGSPNTVQDDREMRRLCAALDEIKPQLQEAEALLESEKERLMQLEIEVRKAAEVAQFPNFPNEA